MAEKVHLSVTFVLVLSCCGGVNCYVAALWSVLLSNQSGARRNRAQRGKQRLAADRPIGIGSLADQSIQKPIGIGSTADQSLQRPITIGAQADKLARRLKGVGIKAAESVCRRRFEDQYLSFPRLAARQIEFASGRVAET